MGEENNNNIVIEMLNPKLETIQTMDNTIDGVPWNEGGEDSRGFVNAFTEVLKTCSLTGRSKLILRQRFLNLYNRYRSKYKVTNVLHNSSRIIVNCWKYCYSSFTNFRQ